MLTVSPSFVAVCSFAKYRMSSSFTYTFTKLRNCPCSVNKCFLSSANSVVNCASAPPPTRQRLPLTPASPHTPAAASESSLSQPYHAPQSSLFPIRCQRNATDSANYHNRSPPVSSLIVRYFFFAKSLEFS